MRVKRPLLERREILSAGFVTTRISVASLMITFPNDEIFDEECFAASFHFEACLLQVLCQILHEELVVGLNLLRETSYKSPDRTP